MNKKDEGITNEPVAENNPPQKPPKKQHPWIRALTNPHMLICLAVAWMLTNGWSYLMFGIGYLFSIDWMLNVSLVYLGLLWFPGSPEKLVTFAVAIILLRLIFPKDERTLALLRRKQRELFAKVKEKIKKIRNRFRKKQP